METTTSNTPPANSPSQATAARPAHTAAHGAAQPAAQRQFVNFAFYKLDPAFRRLRDEEKQAARGEFVSLVGERRPGMICLTYSAVGLRPEVDFMLWRISLTPDDFQSHSALINHTTLGKYL